MTSGDDELFRFSLRGLLLATTACAVAAGVAVLYPTVAILTAFAAIFIALHFPQLFLRYFPRTTLLAFASIGLAYVGAAIYGVCMTGDLDGPFAGKVFLGSLMLLITWLSYRMVQQREV